MKCWLQTRGVVRDYEFLGERPPDFWWSEGRYEDFTSFEQPTLILERCEVEKEWQCLISAIPSTRRDHLQTRIRYFLVLRGRSEEHDLLLKIISNALHIFENYPSSEHNQLTEILDNTVGYNFDIVDIGGEKGRDCLKGLLDGFSKLEILDISSSIKEKLIKLVKWELGGISSCLLLNFIADKSDALLIDLEKKFLTDRNEVLILPSPVMGGKISDFFYLSVFPDISQAEESSRCKRSDYEGLEEENNDHKGCGDSLYYEDGNFSNLEHRCRLGKVSKEKVKQEIKKGVNQGMEKFKNFLIINKVRG